MANDTNCRIFMVEIDWLSRNFIRRCFPVGSTLEHWRNEYVALQTGHLGGTVIKESSMFLEQ